MYAHPTTHSLAVQVTPSHSISAYPGQTIPIMVAAVGQRNGTNRATIDALPYWGRLRTIKALKVEALNHNMQY